MYTIYSTPLFVSFMLAAEALALPLAGPAFEEVRSMAVPLFPTPSSSTSVKEMPGDPEYVMLTASAGNADIVSRPLQI